MIGLLLPGLTVKGQEVWWGHKLLGYSSEYRPGSYGHQYRAIQILGEPNKLPDTGDSPCAWTPAEPDGAAEEWIKVGFERTILTRQVVIAENHNPGAIVRVYAYDPDGKEYLVSDGTSLRKGAEAGRLLHLILAQPVMANAVKIVLKPSLVPGYNQIDAIGLSDQGAPVQVRVETASDMPDDLKKVNLGPGVNSRGKEVAPVIASDEKSLFFTRSEHPGNTGPPGKQDVWVAALEADGRWGTAVNMGPPINNEGDNAVLGVSSSGKTLYLLNAYKPDGQMVQGFSRSHQTRNGWSFPTAFVIEDHYNDSRTNQTEMAISPMENVLILSVQRRDTRGSKDLYVCFLKPSGTWSAPVNMGSVLNTADYEGTPYLAADTKTLYFTSLGHRGYGDGDIFVSRRLDDTWLNWSKPLNLGPVINSPGWDAYFSIPASGQVAYLSSSENPGQSDDLYRVPLYPSVQPEMQAMVTGKLVNAESGQAVSGRVTITRETTGEVIGETDFDPETGAFALLLPMEGAYLLQAEKEGFFPVSEEIIFEKGPMLRTLQLIPLKSGQRIHLKEVRFAQSSAVIDSSSYQELGRLATLMQQHPAMEILLEGHTDNQGDFNKNVKLSEERVQAVLTYLISRGVSEARVQLKAWGPSRPLGNNLTEESRKSNRRVEVTILKI